MKIPNVLFVVRRLTENWESLDLTAKSALQPAKFPTRVPHEAPFDLSANERETIVDHREERGNQKRFFSRDREREIG